MLYYIPTWLHKYLSPEDRMTIQCSNYLKSKGVLFHHTFNEGKRSRTMRAKLIGFGVLTGIPDILIFEAKGGYHGLAIELKVKYENGSKNYQSKNQKQVEKDLIDKGWYCVTVWSVEDFIKEFDNYMKLV